LGGRGSCWRGGGTVVVVPSERMIVYVFVVVEKERTVQGVGVLLMMA